MITFPTHFNYKIWLLFWWRWLHVGHSLVTPPHLLACPGAQDKGSQSFCSTTGNVSFQLGETSVFLSEGFVTVWAVRQGGAFGSIQASFHTIGSDESNPYFFNKSGKIVWGPYDAAPKAISVYLTNSSNATTYSVTFRIALQVISPFSLRSRSIPDLLISVKDSRVSTGAINFVNSETIVVPSDSVGTIQVTVSRSGGSGCNASVIYQTVPVPGFDFGHYGGTYRNYGQIFWPQGDQSDRNVTIQIIPNPGVQGTPERFYLELVSPVCSPLAPGYSRLAVTVLNRNVPGVLRLDRSYFVFNSGSAESVVSIPVSRVGGSAGVVSVEYTTVPDSAAAGVQYRTSSGILLWLPSDAGAKSISITILRALPTDPNPQTQFLVRLIFVAGTTIQGPNIATVVIQNTLLSYGLLGFQQELPCPDPVPTGNCMYAIDSPGKNQSAVLVLLRRGGSQGIVSVGIQVQADVLVRNLTSMLTWGHLDPSPKVLVLPLAELRPTRNDSAVVARVTLYNPDPTQRSFVDPAWAQLSVVFVAPGSGGIFSVSFVNVSVSQSGSGLATFSIRRSDSALGDATVLFETVSNSRAVNEIGCDGMDCDDCRGLSSAYPGQSCNLTFFPFLNAVSKRDYVPLSGNVSWGPGDASERIVKVRILNDFVYSYGDYFKYFSLRLIRAYGSLVHEFAIDENHQEAVACITDDNAQTGFFLFVGTDYDELSNAILNSPAAFSYLEANQTLQIIVQRKGGNAGNVSVDFRTMQISERCNGLTCPAEAGKHFVSMQGRLEWYEGDQSDRQIPVKILHVTGWNSSTVYRRFQLVLENVTLFSGRQKARSYLGPQQVVANITIEESDGPGLATFEVSHLDVQENVGNISLQVNRVGGRKLGLVVSYSTKDGSAQAALTNSGAQSFPLDCGSFKQSGIARIRGADGIREVYCDMTDPQGSASIFHWDQNKSILWDRQCVTVGAGGGGFRLDQNLGAELSTGESGTAVVLNWQHNNMQIPAGNQKSLRPIGIGTYARPVSFPLNNITVWFDWENRSVIWNNISTLNNISFDSLDIEGTGGMNDSRNEYYFISDGINSVHLGCINVTSEIPPANRTSYSAGVNGIYGPEKSSVYPDLKQWNILVLENEDDAFVHIPDFGFDFIWNGKNYRSSAYIGSNGYITFGSGSVEYSNLSLWNPPYPSIHFGSADNSWQLVVFKMIFEGGIKGIVIRYEGTTSMSGTLSEPNIIAEISFFANGRIRIIKAQHAKKDLSLFLLTAGAGLLEAQILSNQSQTFYFWTQRPQFSNNSTVLRFDWSTGRVQREKVAPLTIDVNSLCRSQVNSFGHMLWTVNGRVMYRDCTLRSDASSLHLILGGTLRSPNIRKDYYSFSKCPETYFEKCKGWIVNSEQSLIGLTLFSNVDHSGFVYFGDVASSYSSGLFQCGVHQFGVARTGIELGLSIRNDYSASSGSVVWNAGDIASKFINISILDDGVVDHQVLESFTVELTDAGGYSMAGLDTSTAVITILDLNGPGKISAHVDPMLPSPLPERGYSCSSSSEGASFCTQWNIARSSARGAICVDISPVGNKSGLPLLNAVAGVHFVSKIETICWSHEDQNLKNVSVSLVPNNGYDTLYKSFNLTVAPTNNLVLKHSDVNGSTYWSRITNASSIPYYGSAVLSTINFGAYIDQPAITTIYDMDAQAGQVTFSTDLSTGNSIFTVTYDQYSAALLVQRLQGQDTDLSVYYSTEVISDLFKTEGTTNNSISRVPIAVSAIDGSNGSNIFCSALESRSGTCFDSSSNIKCDLDNGICTFLLTVDVDPAVSGNGFNSTAQRNQPADFLPSSGVLNWKEGDQTPKGIAIPIFHPNHTLILSESAAIYRAFGIFLVNASSSQIQNGKRLRLNTSLPLPPRRLFEDCNACPQIDDLRAVYQGQSKDFCNGILCPCQHLNCRNSSSSSALVVMPTRFSTPGSFRLLNTTYFIPENISSRSVSVIVQRVGGYSGLVSVDFQSYGIDVANLSVSAKSDEVVFLNGTLIWQNEDMANKYISIPIINDKKYTLGRLTKSFRVALMRPSQGTYIEAGFDNVTQIVVDDDCTVGSFVFASSLVSADEKEGIARIGVARVGGNESDAYVRLTTSKSQYWESIAEQAGSFDAFSSYLVDQSYACGSMMEGLPKGSIESIEKLFDFNLTSGVDSDMLPSSTHWIIYSFPNCKLAGISVSGYAFYTLPSGPCPRHWTFEATSDDLIWDVVHMVSNGTCNPTGEFYGVFAGNSTPMIYRSFRWTFFSDSFGTNRLRLSEISLSFNMGATKMIPAPMCNISGDCCQFQGGKCDPLTGHNLMLRNTEYDYEYSTELLTWNDGEEGIKYFVVPLFLDFLGCTEKTCMYQNQFNDRPSEYFAVTMSNPLSGNSLGEVIPWTHPVDLTRASIPYHQLPSLDKRFSTVRIVDDDGPGIFSLYCVSCANRAGYSVPDFVSQAGQLEGGFIADCPILETAYLVGFKVNRSGIGRGAVSVEYAVESVLDAQSDDFLPNNGTLVWAHGDTLPKYFSVLIKTPQNTTYTTNQYARPFKVMLKNAEGGASISPCQRSVDNYCVEPEKGSVVVNMIDVNANPGDIKILYSELVEADQYPVDIAQGSLNITILRKRGSDLPLKIHYSTEHYLNDDFGLAAVECADGVPLNDCQYWPVHGMLNWDDGVDLPQLVNITLNSYSSVTRDSKFIFRIWGSLQESLPFCGGFDGNVPDSRFVDLFCETKFSDFVVITVSVRSGGYFGLIPSQWPYAVIEGQEIRLAVMRTKYYSGVVSVEYQTYGGSALPSVNYLSAAKRLSWLDNDNTSRMITIPTYQILPANAIVDLYVRLIAATSNSIIIRDQQEVHVVIHGQGASYAPQFTLCDVSESTRAQSELNTISFRFSTNAFIGPFATFTITGLEGTDTYSSSALAVIGTDAVKFGNFSEWDQPNGILKLTVVAGQSLAPQFPYTFSIKLKNPTRSQAGKLIGMKINVIPFCNQLFSTGLSCPDTISISSIGALLLGISKSSILQGDSESFTVLNVSSHLCPYLDCPHSPYFGSRNYLFIYLRPTSTIPSQSLFTIRGLERSSTLSGNLTIRIINAATSTPGLKRNQTSLCVCTSEDCGCSHVFSGIPRVATANLIIRVQCNYLGRALQVYGDEALLVRVGYNHTYTRSTGLNFDSSCFDQCDVSKEIFLTPLNVSNLISDSGLLFVSISMRSSIDFCGSGEFLRAELILSWITETSDLVDLTSTLNQTGGSIVFSLPPLYSLNAQSTALVVLPLGNPNIQNTGSSLFLEATSAFLATKFGPSRIEGSVLEADRDPQISFASLDEFSTADSAPASASDILQFKILFNGPVGGLEEGLFISIEGLDMYGTEDSAHLPVIQCESCEALTAFSIEIPIAPLVGNEKTRTAGTGIWRKEDGRFDFYLQGVTPTFLIPHQILAGAIVLHYDTNLTINSDANLQGNISLSVAGEAVRGARLIPGRPVLIGGCGRTMLHSNVIADAFFAQAEMTYTESFAFMPASSLNLSVELLQTLQPSDVIKIYAPSLTTCSSLCYDGMCRNKNGSCVDIGPRLLRSSMPSSQNLLDDSRSVFVFNWNEARKEIELRVHFGRVLKKDNEFQALIISSIVCENYECSLKLVPDPIATQPLETEMSIDVQRCPEYFPPLASCSATLIAVRTGQIQKVPGVNWAQFSVLANQLGQIVGRVWFAAQEHAGVMYLIGGVSKNGFEKNIMKSFDGTSWNETMTSSAVSLGRAFFPSLSHRGYLWIFGGRTEQSAKTSDVWKSADGDIWCQVTMQATWSPRQDHAALEHSDFLWVLGGVSDTKVESDVWFSSDGMVWSLATSQAAFSGRSRFSAVSFNSRIWVFGGSLSTDGVWFSHDGIDWSTTLLSTPWSRRYLHQGLVYQNRMWVVGSLQNTSQRDVWSTGDGNVWKQATNTAAFGARMGYSAVVFDKRLWVIGGATEECDELNATSCLSAALSTSDCGRLEYVGYFRSDSCQLSDIWINTYKYAEFEVLELSGSSETYGADNKLDLLASLDMDLEIGASIVIDGLDSTGQDGVDSPILVTGLSSHYFNYSAYWRNTPQGGSILLAVTIPVLELSIFSISLHLQNRDYNQSFRNLYVNAFSAHFDSSVGNPWASQSTIQDPQPIIRLSSTSELLSGLERPYADIYVNVMLGRDALASSMISNQIVPLNSLNSSWIGFLDLYTANYYRSVLNYSFALKAWFPEADIRLAKFCKNTSCYECRYESALQSPSCSLLAASTSSSAGDSVTIVFSHIFNALDAQKILSNEGCFFEMALSNVNYNFSINAVEYYTSYRTVCPPGYLNSSERILLCFEPPRIFDGGMMFDIDVLSNILVTNFEIDVNVLTSRMGIDETIFLYYKGGSYLQQRKCTLQDNANCSGSIFNLSEWRYLGKVTVENSFSGRISFDVSELDTDITYENAAMCTSETLFDCEAGQQAIERWLGPQPTWAQDSLTYMSSKFDESVNITGVLVQSNFSIWHSGSLPSENDTANLEVGCPNLPVCPEVWPYNKRQWLAFDLKACYQISGFRTRFPRIDLAPTYKYQNLTRTDKFFSNLTEKQAWWSRAQFKEFSFQYSSQSIDGPWSTALNDQAKIGGTDWQEFFFQPVIARYWKLLMFNNFGFGYMAIQAIEFFGSESIWCQDSSWCKSAVLCDSRADDTIAIALNAAGPIQDKGLGLMSGVHSFFLRSTLGSGIGVSERPRGTFSSSDEHLVIKEGSAFENNPPFYAWERSAQASYDFAQVQLHNLASELLKSSQVLTIHLRFKAPAMVKNETLLMLGDLCSQGLGLQILDGFFVLVQGCGTSATSLRISNLGTVVSGQSYCASFSLSEAHLQARLEKLSATVMQAPVSVTSFSSFKFYFPQFSELIIGASSPCGLGKFSGIVLGISLYADEQNETSMRTACRRTCAATSTDGSCLDSSSFKLEQNLLTSCAADVIYMTLPSPVLSCFVYFRFQVPSISVSKEPWCLQEISLFQTNAPYWQDIRTLNITSAVTCSQVNNSDCSLSFDGMSEGNISGGNKDAFCTPGSQNDWIAFDFGSRVCITGYALLAPDNISKYSMPNTWVIQGSNDGLSWTLLDKQSSVTFRRNMWRKYSFGSQLQPYLFFPQFYNSSQTFSYNTLSKLYRWTGEGDGWALAQEISTRGARKAEYYAVDGDHFVLIASARDSTIISAARTNDGRPTDSQVMSDIFRWTGSEFEEYDSLVTNNSLDIKYFHLDKNDYLISADNRIASSEDTVGVNGQSSVLFARQRSYLKQTCNDSLYCKSCSCSTMWFGTANTSSKLESNYEPFHAFDGDSSTFWRGIFPNLFFNISLTWEFESCSSGAFVAAYSIFTTEKSCPQSWELYGSNDKITWSSLDARRDQLCLDSARSATFVLSPRFDQRIVTGSDSEPNIQPYRFYQIVFFNPGWDFDVNNEGGYHEHAIEISEIEFIFLSSSNAALIATEVPWTVSAYDFSAYDTPYSTVYHDSDGFNVPGLIETKFNYTGIFNTFDVELIESFNMSNSNLCIFNNYYGPGEFWDVGISPFWSCTSYWDLCSESFAVCFVEGMKNDSTRISLEDDQRNQIPVQKYLYKISFKSTVRLISLRMRGCGWCNGTVSVMDRTRTVLARKNYAHVTDCSTCISWRLKIDSLGREFYLSEENMARISLRAAISLDYETVSEWEVVQLLPTKGANDFEFFSIMEDSFLVVANYREYDDCYGDIECINPQDSMPASRNASMPFDIDSTIFIFKNDTSNGLFVSFQNISTHGALDWEHFVLDGNHYLAVANSFTSLTSSPACMSAIYIWNTSTYSFDLFQEIATYGARKWKQFEKNGAHFLAVANTLHSETLSLEISIYRWLGSYFVFAGNLPNSAASAFTVFEINHVTYVAVANIHGLGNSDDMYLTNSSIYKWHDSARFLGSIFYTNAYARSSDFVVKSIFSNSSTSDSVSNLVVSLACNSKLLQYSLLSIGGLFGSQSETKLINVSGAGANFFGYQGSWNKDLGALVLTLTSDVARLTPLEFNFGLVNGADLAAPVRPFVSCSGRTNIAAKSMSGLVLGVDILLGATFTERIISESSIMQNYPNNRLSAMLKANRPIPAGARLTVSNLSGALHTSSTLNVSGPNATLFNQNGNWLADSVWFTVAQPIPSLAAFQVDFYVNNGPRAQSPRLVSVAVQFSNGSILLGPFQCNGLVLSFADNPSFQTAVIQGSNNINGSVNTIFVSLQPGIPIPQSGRITIVGLLQPNRNIGDAVMLMGAPRDLSKFRERKAILFSSPFSLVVDSLILELNGTMSNLVPTVFSFQLQNYFDQSQPLIPSKIRVSACLSRDNPGYGSLSASSSCEVPLQDMTNQDGGPVQFTLSNSTNISVLSLSSTQVVTTFSKFESIRLDELTIETWIMIGTDPMSSDPVSKQILSIGNSIVIGFNLGISAKGYAINFNISSSDITGLSGQWVHLTARWTSDTGIASYFVNGDLKNNMGGVLTGRSLLLSGALFLGSSEGYVTLKMAQVRVWSLALADQNIIWTPSKTSFAFRFLNKRFIPRAIVASYDFQDAGNDASTFGHNLNLTSVIISKSFPSSIFRLNEYIYPSATLSNLAITSSNKFPSGDTCINITFSSNVPLSPGVRLSVYGLLGTQTYMTHIPIFATASGSSRLLLSGGNWDNIMGMLTLTLETVLKVNSIASFSFTLINNALDQPGQRAQLSVQDGLIFSFGDIQGVVGNTTFSGLALESNSKLLNISCNLQPRSMWLQGTCAPDVQFGVCPLYKANSWGNTTFPKPCDCLPRCPTATFKSAACSTTPSNYWRPTMEVTDSTSQPGQPNRIYFKLRPDRSLQPGSLIRITGLTGTYTEDKHASNTCFITDDCFIQLSGPSASQLMNSSGSWSKNSGELLLWLQTEMNPLSDFEFSIQILNGINNQNYIVPSIEVIGSVLISETKMCGQILRILPSIVQWSNFAEDNCGKCLLNTISISFQLNSNLGIGAGITISNMTGLLVQSGPIAIQGKYSYKLQNFDGKAGIASWNFDNSSLMLLSRSQFSAGETISLQFVMLNGFKEQQPLSPVLTVNGSGSYYSSRMTGNGLTFRGNGSLLNLVEDDDTRSSWLPTGWFASKYWLSTSLPWRKRATGACCFGKCCSLQSCCSCADLLRNPNPKFEETGTFFVGSACEMFCDRRIYVFGGNMNETSNLNYADGGKSVWNAPTEVSSSSVSILLNQTYFTAIVANFGPKAVQMTLPISQVLSTASPIDACSDSQSSSANNKILVIQRGECDFTHQIRQAQYAGAIAAIIFNNVAGQNSFVMQGTESDIIIPALMTSYDSGMELVAGVGHRVTVSLSAASTPQSPSSRIGHSAISVKKLLYIYGGEAYSHTAIEVCESGNFFREFWVFDPVSVSWTDITDPRGPDVRCGHSLVVTMPPIITTEQTFIYGNTERKQTIILFGGKGSQDQISGELWSFDPLKYVWTNQTSNVTLLPNSLALVRWAHCTAVFGENIYFFGGKSKNGTVLKDFWLLTVDESGVPLQIKDLTLFNFWHQCTVHYYCEYPSARWGHSAAAVSVKASNEEKMQAANRVYSLQDVFVFKIYMFGGNDANNEVLGDFWIFDPIKQVWSRIHTPSLSPPPRWGHASVGAGGKFYVIGGKGINNETFNDVWRWDPEVPAWEDITGYIGTGKRWGLSAAAASDFTETIWTLS